MSETAADIRYLERNEIDILKWDNCIAHAYNGLIYAHSFYLDIMAKNWSALVLNDYEAVMPLTWNRKYGFTYLYQPAFTPQLGLFAKNNMDLNMMGQFITEMKKHFKFSEIHLNSENETTGYPLRANYVLELHKSYEIIRAGYKKRLLENLSEAGSYDLHYSQENNFTSTIKLFRQEYGKRLRHVKEKDYRRFNLLCDELMKRRMLIVRQVKDVSGSLLSSSIFFKDQHRIYNIMSVTLKPGREKRSHFFLIDQLIREFSPLDLLLDFEGSEVPGIAEFYKKFGSRLSPYPFLKYNHLPIPFRHLK